MTETNSTTVYVGDDAAPWGVLRLDSGVLDVFDDSGDIEFQLTASDLVDLIDVARDNEDRLRELVRAKHAMRLWDEAHRIVRDLVARGIRVMQIDAKPKHMEISLFSAEALRNYAVGVNVTERVSHGVYLVTEAEVTPGVVLSYTTSHTETGEQS